MRVSPTPTTNHGAAVRAGNADGPSPAGTRAVVATKVYGAEDIELTPQAARIWPTSARTTESLGRCDQAPGCRADRLDEHGQIVGQQQVTAQSSGLTGDGLAITCTTADGTITAELALTWLRGDVNATVKLDGTNPAAGIDMGGILAVEAVPPLRNAARRRVSPAEGRCPFIFDAVTDGELWLAATLGFLCRAGDVR